MVVGVRRVSPRAAAAVALVLASALAGCAGTPGAELAPPADALGLPPGLNLTADQFTLPAPRVGDVVISDVVYQYHDDESKTDIRTRERYSIVSEEPYLDGYGRSRLAHHVNVTYYDILNDTEAYWEEYWVDVATHEAIGYHIGSAGGVLAYRHLMEVGGVALFDAQARHTLSGPASGNYYWPNFLSTPGLHGGFGQEEVLPKNGVVKLFNAGLDLLLDLRFEPSQASTGATALNLTDGPLETYRMALKAQTRYRMSVEVGAEVTPALPYPLAAYSTYVGRYENGSTAWREHYAFQVASLERGRVAVGAGAAAAADAPAVTGSELTDTFPLGGTTLLTITPRMAKDAALYDPRVAGWFDANPNAFLSYYSLFWGDLHHIAGALYNSLQESQYKALQLAFSYAEWTNPKNGESVGFLTSAWMANGQAAPVTYNRHDPFAVNPPDENFYTFKRDQWLANRGNVVDLGRALEHYRETGGPYASKAPNVVEFWTYGNSAGGGGAYFLGYQPQPSSSDGSVATGTGFYSGWTLHYATTALDGFKQGQGTWLSAWEQSVSVAGVRLPI